MSRLSPVHIVRFVQLGSFIVRVYPSQRGKAGGGCVSERGCQAREIGRPVGAGGCGPQARAPLCLFQSVDFLLDHGLQFLGLFDRLRPGGCQLLVRGVCGQALVVGVPCGCVFLAIECFAAHAPKYPGVFVSASGALPLTLR